MTNAIDNSDFSNSQCKHEKVQHIPLFRKENKCFKDQKNIVVQNIIINKNKKNEKVSEFEKGPALR